MPNYLKAIYIKEWTHPQGWKKLNVSVKVDEFIEQLQAMKNEKGYANFDIMQYKQPNQYGNTHYATEKDYKKDDTPF